MYYVFTTTPYSNNKQRWEGLDPQVGETGVLCSNQVRKVRWESVSRYGSGYWVRGIWYQGWHSHNTYRGGMCNASVGAQVCWNCIQDSMACNPTFDFTMPCYFTANAELAFPYQFFVNSRNQSAQLNLTVACDFFQNGHFPWTSNISSFCQFWNLHL